MGLLRFFGLSLKIITETANIFGNFPNKTQTYSTRIKPITIERERISDFGSLKSP